MAWMLRDPTGPDHESPASRLPALAALIAAVHVSPIEGYGSMDLIMNEAATSAATGLVLERVARALRERDSAGLEDHHFLHSFRDESREEGRVQGRMTKV